MSDNYPPGAKDDPKAPYNELLPDVACPKCGSNDIDTESHNFNHLNWAYRWCNTCGYEWDDEPDFDPMKGGPDYDG